MDSRTRKILTTKKLISNRITHNMDTHTLVHLNRQFVINFQRTRRFCNSSDDRRLRISECEEVFQTSVVVALRPTPQ